MRNHPDSSYVTPAMAARLLSVTRQRVSALLDEGKLVEHREFGHRYVKRDSVQEYLAVSAREGEMMTVSDVAAYFGVPRNRVARWIRKGLLPATQSRKRLLVEPAVVSAFRPPPPGRWPEHERNTP